MQCFTLYLFICLQVSRPEDDELKTALKFLSNENRTVIITIINKSHTEEEGMLDLFLKGLRGGKETDYLIDRILFVAVDQVALSRCTEMQLNCYKLEMSTRNLSQGPSSELNLVDDMWTKSYFLGMVLKLGYSFIFTSIDVLWLRNPLNYLVRKGEDMSISCDTYNGQPFDNSNSINRGIFFVASNNKTITFFDKLYAARNNSGLTEQDKLYDMKTEGAFHKLNMKVGFLDTDHFCGLCQMKCNIKKVMTLHANCCGTKQAKISYLTAVLKIWLRSDGVSSVKWPKHKACLDSSKIPDELRA
ncbi:Nucleotide-diphospho-sugar transferase family protein [Rhynchospora pubera]|uniref:Nucleotide-diphospho-sugar transferase family protein n=1 Tax=Rhynchospora pubera TaxID=906938 RepID=A0AAV8G991_9POAL|nr:Nucleotide-diphospho-sugar transferase family protein [Rhynchospora pubera]